MTTDTATDYLPPLGPRYSQLYLERGPVQADSPRLRSRIAAFVEAKLWAYDSAVSSLIQMRIGTEQRLNENTVAIARYLKDCSEDDFRDSITVICEAIDQRNDEYPYESSAIPSSDWRDFCRDVFIEENIAFRVDERCMVHPFVDEEFSQAVTSLLRGLDDPRLRAVNAEVVRAVDALGGRNPDPKGAVRAIFEAVEIYSKLAVKTCRVQRLNRNIVAEHLVPAFLKRPEYKDPASQSVACLGEAMIDWIDACHVYRHGQGVHEPSPPPPDLAVALVSGGLTHLRLLLDAAPLPAIDQ